MALGSTQVEELCKSSIPLSTLLQHTKYLCSRAREQKDVLGATCRVLRAYTRVEELFLGNLVTRTPFYHSA